MIISTRARFLFLFCAMLPILFVSQNAIIKLFRDNENYFAAYNAVGAGSFSQAFFAHFANTGSIEPIYFALSFVAASAGIGYTSYVFVLNLAFSISLAGFLSVFKVKMTWFFLLCGLLIFSFYPLVFFSELHRLKLALVFLFVYLASLARGDGGGFIKFFSLSVNSHFQSFLIFVEILLVRAGFKIIRSKVFFFLLLIFGIIFGAAFQKVLYYLSESVGGYLDTIAICVFISIYFLLFQRRFFFRSLLSCLPVVFSSLLFGGGRVNFILIFGFFFLGFYLISEKRLYRAGRVVFAIVILTWCVYGSLLTQNYLMSVNEYVGTAG